MSAYRLLFNTVLRHLDPERAHHLAFVMIRGFGLPGVRRIMRRITQPKTSLRVCTLGLEFPTPFGLAAGFDKNASAITGLGLSASATSKSAPLHGTRRPATTARDSFV